MLTALLALAAAVSPVAGMDIPPLTGRVVDLAGVIPPDREIALTDKLAAFEASDSTQIAVLTIPGLEGEDLTTYSHRVASGWELGQKQKNNGVLLLVSIQEHDIRIEVGYGLEGRLPDITAGKIIRNEIAPRFQQNDMPAGIEAGVDAIIKAVRGEYQGTGEPTGSLSKESPGGGLFFFLIATVVISAIAASVRRLFGGFVGAIAWIIGGFIFLGVASWLLILLLAPVLFGAGMISPELLRAVLTARSVSGGGGGGGRSGGGGFSGGGGSFGGGGASGKW